MIKIAQHIPRLLVTALAAALAASPAAIAQNTGTQNNAAVPPAKAKPVVKASTAAGNAAAAPGNHETVEYKDPEDMTTRYRPGNNKTTALPPGGSTNAAGPAATGDASATDAKKHVSNIKWSDRQAAVPALDGASKDAAKSKTAPAAGAQTDPKAQDSKHVNKVDSFTVKQ